MNYSANLEVCSARRIKAAQCLPLPPGSQYCSPPIAVTAVQKSPTKATFRVQEKLHCLEAYNMKKTTEKNSIRSPHHNKGITP